MPWELLSDQPHAMLPPLLWHPWGPGAEPSHSWSEPGKKAPGLGAERTQPQSARGRGPSLGPGPGGGVEPRD